MGDDLILKKKIRILMTSCGGLVIPGMIKCLREENEFDFHIVGVDANEQAVGRYFADSFYVVPYGYEDNYIEVILSIAIAEKVDVIIPLSDEEVLALSSKKAEFERNGIKILCSDYEMVKIASDKGKMLTYLKDKNIEVPNFFLPKNIKELDEALQKLGYPEKEIVLKPTKGRGARGFWIITKKYNGQDLLLKERNLQKLPYRVIRSLLMEKDCLTDVVVMDYLGGDDFNVDALSLKGKTIYSLPIKRIVPNAGPVQVGQHVHDSQIDGVVKEIIDKFKFSYNINIELAYRNGENKGKPLVYEINPRISAPIAAHKYAGVNVLLYGILLCLGYDFSMNLQYDEIYTQRYWNEMYNFYKHH